MPTTSNFGWTTPADTDLVKDGAAAIRTLGNGIDTSLVDLKGGTTGQYLIKQSNTDLDFTWTTNTADIDGVTATSPLTGGGTSGTITVGIQDATTAQKGAVQLTDSTSSTSTTTAATPNSVKTAYDLANGAIPKSLVDAKADLITATADNTPARLAVGNNGETLVADSSASTGLRWQATPSASNPVINSAMDIWQRGTSFASSGLSGFYTADRWQAYRNTTGQTVSRQATNDTTNLPFIQYSARVARDSGNTSTSALFFVQTMESNDSRYFAGKTFTLSFYAKKGANFSSASDALGVLLQSGTGTDQNVLDGFTGVASVISQTATLTTTWQRFSFTGTAASSTTQLGIRFSYTPVGTAGAADNFEITGIQLDVGSVALPYRRYSATLAGELATCQRYYEISYDIGTAPGTSTTTGMYGDGITSGSNSTAYFLKRIAYKVNKRGTPTITLYDSVGNSGKCSVFDSATTTITNNITCNADQISTTSFRCFESGTSCAGFSIHFVASAEL